MLRTVCLLLALITPFAGTVAVADEFKPAMLEIRETEPGWYAVTWKVPLQNGRPLDMAPILPSALERMGPPATRVIQGSAVEESTWSSEAGVLVGSTIEIGGLTGLPIDVILQIDLADGSEHAAILRSASATFVVPERATKWTVAASYWKIGTIHILEGFDHLLFVLALMLIIPNIWMLVKTITAFTVSHSISLALATLGVVNMPGAPTEAVIALSILFLAVEIVHSQQGRVTLTETYPWVVALSFGLVHGLVLPVHWRKLGCLSQTFRLLY
jgi:hydrogenase/urease accessory protein HupE